LDNKLANGKVNFIPLFDTGIETTESAVVQSMPAAGTLSRFYVRLSSTAFNKDKGAYVFTVRKNGLDTGVACTIGVGGTDANGLIGMDLEHNVEFKEGDTIAISSTPSDNPNPAAMRWMARFQ